jgi:hypothetical protein
MKGLRTLPLSALARGLDTSAGTFLCCASFERRCLSVAENIPAETIRSAIICEYENLRSRGYDFGAKLLDLYPGKSASVIFRRNDPLGIADSLQAEFEKIAKVENNVYVVDVTTFTHETLLILLQLIRRSVRSGDRVWLVYTKAKEYSVGQEIGEKWLSKGIGGIRSVLGYPGEMLPSRTVHLIILTGFETERAAMLVSKYEPAKVSLGFVDSAVVDNERGNKGGDIFRKSFLSQYESADVFSFSCFDPIKTKEVILRQAAKYQGYNVVVAAMNTKISTLGAGLAAIENEAIQLCYAFANQYNYAAYSEPSETCILWDASEILV